MYLHDITKDRKYDKDFTQVYYDLNTWFMVNAILYPEAIFSEAMDKERENMIWTSDVRRTGYGHTERGTILI